MGGSQLDPHKDYLRERTSAGVWNAKVLLRELTDGRGYEGGYTILTDWLRPLRQTAAVAAVRRFETPPGRQAQVDWGHLGTLEVNERKARTGGLRPHARPQPDAQCRGGHRPEDGIARSARVL